MKNMNEIGKDQYETNIANGFDIIEPSDFTDDKYKIPAALALIGTEVSETVEAFRHQDFDNFAEELADVILRVISVSCGMGINIEKEVLTKLETNRSRKNRHGGKRI